VWRDCDGRREWWGEPVALTRHEIERRYYVPQKLATLGLSGNRRSGGCGGQGATLAENRINLQTSSRHCGARNGIPAYRLAYNGRLSPVGSRHPAVSTKRSERRSTWGSDHEDYVQCSDDNDEKYAENDKRSENWTLEQNRARVRLTPFPG
jgi:hypothetical protein